ncbi:hypothetical protein [Protaetiibacter mangrovi]|uniref:PASTA domain-containing protein n=1 Tax=Protaetiibacter mangrovi TaxID=2970926 RepID=A0ABT1ZE67_9MICO|nr:hypothetical protein [Protaetiibacter mangrovi]MCS0498990.1 hypothetical protein [Protaetiibacter mangrovi]TPX02280.1 hypothetical protein FJ656_23225 [Schumannella luteola]
MSHRIRIAAALAALTLATGALTGCSLIPNPVRDIVEQGTGGGGSGSDNPLGSIPADFPSEVPLVDGDVIAGLKVNDRSWGVTIRVADEAAADQAKQLMLDAGFTELIEGASAYEKDDLKVVIVAGPADDDEGGYAVAYTVVIVTE